MTFEEADALNQAIRLLTLRSRARAAAMLAPYGLFPGQEVMLLELAKNGPCIQAQLSDRLGCEPPSVTLMATKLEASGYVHRRPSATDKRAMIVELTTSGEDLIDPIKRVWVQLAEDAVKTLPSRSVAGLAATLRDMSRNLSDEANG